MLPLATLVKKSIQLIQKEGLSAFHSRARDYLSRYISLKSYLNYQNLLKKKAKLHRNWYLQNGRPVSIIIPSYNDSHYLKKCLQSLKCTLPPHSADSMEILIIDDASTLQEHQDFLKNLSLPQTGIPIQVIQKQKNEGFASTVHLGLQQIGEKDCVILNSDIEAHAGWLEALQFAAYQKESIIGKKNRDMMPPDFADLIDEKIKCTLQTGSLQIFEYQLELPQKGIGYFEARMVQCSNNRVLDRKSTRLNSSH